MNPEKQKKHKEWGEEGAAVRDRLHKDTHTNTHNRRRERRRPHQRPGHYTTTGPEATYVLLCVRVSDAVVLVLSLRVQGNKIKTGNKN